MREGLRAGEVVGEGRVEEGGGVRGSEASRRSTRGDQAAVCVHVDTQSGGFGVLALLPTLEHFIIIIYYSWNGGRAEAVCAGGKGVRMR